MKYENPLVANLWAIHSKIGAMSDAEVKAIIDGTEVQMTVSDPRVQLTLIGMNRKYPRAEKWQASFRDDGDMRLQSGDKTIIVPQAVMGMINALETFRWIEANADLS